MFYWSHKDVHVVLSDEEEMALVQELGKTPLERIGYHTSSKIRKEIEHRIFHYLEENLCADPDEFNRRFVFRSCYGEEARKIFPMLLDAYGRVTRRATFGLHGDRTPLDGVADSVYYANTDGVFQITLFERMRWPKSSSKVLGYISLPVSSIEKVAGTVDNFFVASATATIKFHRDFVRISILDKEPNQANAADAKNRAAD